MRVVAVQETGIRAVLGRSAFSDNLRVHESLRRRMNYESACHTAKVGLQLCYVETWRKLGILRFQR
jgi:hypothetical protein